MVVSLLYACIPYLAVTLGLLVFRSAWLAILAYHAGILAVLLLSRSGVPFKLRVGGRDYSLLIVNIAAGASSGAILCLLWPLLGVPVDTSGYMRSIGLQGTAWPSFMAYYVIVNGFLEEWFWRGRLGSGSRHPVFNDFLFAGYHLVVLAGKVATPWLVVVFLVRSVGAWYWRQMSRTAGTLLPAVLSHTAADASIILAIHLLAAGA